MTAPAPPGPDGMRPEWLAAYADGELDPATRDEVERWLAAHPGAREALLAQQQLSPANWALWQKADPPLPTEDAWAEVRESIADAVLNPPVPAVESPTHAHWRRRVGVWVAGGLATAAAAVVAWVALRPPGPAPAPDNNGGKPDVVNRAPPPPEPDDPLAGLNVLPIASEDDVDLQRVAGADAGAFPVGEPPLAGPLVLATEDDVEVEGVDEHPGWPAGGPVSVPAPGDAPMIFATKPR
ncbi:MAG TPA: zf-HC2 domain-containing protein [Gemmataceae bacterium]|nr:zf-HC2 domain-containing protein [Gemmataceae bacterium]